MLKSIESEEVEEEVAESTTPKIKKAQNKKRFNIYYNFNDMN